jgi:phosphoribosylanthranilate isomerase
MTTPRVKICGLTSAVDRDAAVTAGADALGFITGVPVETPREITVETAARLADGVPPFVTSVLVTMPASPQAAVARQRAVQADAVQVHGDLTPAQVGALGERLDAALVVAIDTEDPESRAYADAADMLLVDSTTDEGAGGTGETHDWARTRELAATVDVPVALAGGLTPENVREAVETVDPFAVDTASGVEREGGLKDHDAVRAFVARATAHASESRDREAHV